MGKTVRVGLKLRLWFVEPWPGNYFLERSGRPFALALPYFLHGSTVKCKKECGGRLNDKIYVVQIRKEAKKL